MSEVLLTKRTVERVIGQTRLRRLLRAGWLRPVEGSSHPILFSPRDLHAALRRLERSACPPDRIAVAQVRASELRNGRAYVKHPRPEKPALEPDWDLSALDLTKWKGTS